MRERLLVVPTLVWLGLWQSRVQVMFAEALYGTRFQVAGVSFKPAFVDEETSGIYCTPSDGKLPDNNIITVDAKCICPAAFLGERA